MKSTDHLPILAFDVDGTLMDHRDTIHQKDIELLTMPDPPAIFVPATGRSLLAIRRILRSFGICDERPLRFPMVLQNGALIYDPGEVKLRRISFDLPLQAELIGLFKTKPDVSFLISVEDHTYMVNPRPFGLNETRKYMSEPDVYSDNTPLDACTKILCLCEDPEKILEVREMVKDFNLEVVHSRTTMLELNATGVNKGEGLEFLAKHHGWNKNQVYCAGDGDNDLAMFGRFPNSFTPHTSPANIQTAAKFVIDTRQDGLLTPILKAVS
ncbi:MAG: HAD family phosphatase [Leptolinea sp.]|jgi:Cof subfamily protein (haloacid dehalogenase superfamily)|nr:HAD family phosphatase [Leptolinea sp.]